MNKEEPDFELEEVIKKEQDEEAKQNFYEGWGKTDEECYKDGEISPQRELAISILDYFEELLDENDITIPDRDREGNEEEARIYGSVYYSLEDKITSKIEEFIKDNEKEKRKKESKPEA